MTPMHTPPNTIKIEAGTWERVQPLADTRQRSPQSLMREAFLQDGMKAWNDYQATGLHVTMEEADAWLSTLESGSDVEPPECHV